MTSLSLTATYLSEKGKKKKKPLSSQCEQTLGKVNKLSQEGKRGKSLPWPAIIWLWGR